jgi:LysM repeat protein
MVLSWLTLRALRVASLISSLALLTSCAEPQPSPPLPSLVGSPPPVASAAPARSLRRPATAHTRTITVQAGQSLGRLAQAYHVSKQAIVAANQLQAPYELKTGARLVIPAAESGRLAVDQPEKKDKPVNRREGSTVGAHSAKAPKAAAKPTIGEPQVIPLD